MMRAIRLIHWNSDEAAERAERLRIAGYKVDCTMPEGPNTLRHLGTNPPLAIVIDLSRLPSQGRDLALAVRHRRACRYIPLVFVDGDPRKVAFIQAQVPDGVCTEWSRIRAALKQVIAHPSEPRARSSPDRPWTVTREDRCPKSWASSPTRRSPWSMLRPNSCALSTRCPKGCDFGKASGCDAT